MLHDRARHEPLRVIPWNEDLVRQTIERIVEDAEEHFTPKRYWQAHPLDVGGDEGLNQILTPLYFGACGVIWALHYLQSVGAVRLSRSYIDDLDSLLMQNRIWLGDSYEQERASYLMGDTPVHMLSFGKNPNAEVKNNLDSLIAGNLDHPARELMWGSPGTLLAALFLYERTEESRWAELFRLTAAKLWSQLQWSPEYECHYWMQDLYGHQATYLDAVHGFVATTSPLIRGRHLLDSDTWADWEQCIANTIQRTASRSGDQANWRVYLYEKESSTRPMLMQFCHGAPGFVICLAEFPSIALDDLLIASGETIWAAGPLIKGSNLCHGTGGNGYAFLKLYQRTGNPEWLERARAFAMHAIAQTNADALLYGQMRYSLWTGDIGFAIYLWDCLRSQAAFPTLDVCYGS